METVLIVLVVIVAVGVIALLAFTPKIRDRQGAAAMFVKSEVGGEDNLELIERMANSFGSEPAADDDLRGPGVLGLGPETLVFALTPEKSMTISRAAIVSAESSADAGDSGKAMLKVTHRRDGAEVTSSWRLAGAADWAEALSG